MFYKRYEYLEDSYYEDANSTLRRREFLSSIDDSVNQKKLVRITLLNWAEDPIKEIQGVVSSGNLSLDGSSAVRRTCTMTATLDAGSYDIESANMDFAINKKIFVEVGVKNQTKQYPQHPILWFPQGVFLIKTFSASTSATGGFVINLTLEDKMGLLNGDAGGKFPAATILHEQDTQTATGDIVTEKVPVYRIIQELVNHFGGEDLNNIVIEDVDLRLKRIVKWNGSTPLYMKRSGSNESSSISFLPSLDKLDGASQYNQGDDVGYVYEDFTWSGDLTANAGETVTSILDKIKSALGNYEYFYDVFGVFHFREIKNYLNTTQATGLLNDMAQNNYLIETAVPKTVYSFESGKNLVTMSVSPQFEKIKNDFVVLGQKKGTSSSVAYNISYHLAIDTKPPVVSTEEVNGDMRQVYGTYTNLLVYEELGTSIHKAAFPEIVPTLGEFGEFNTIYYMDGKAFCWTQSNAWKELPVIAFFDENNPYKVLDWRTQLYLKGLLARANGTDQGYYFAELEAGWPQIYNLATQKFFGEEDTVDENGNVVSTGDKARALTEGYFFLDFIDAATSPLGKFSVSNIGRRSDVVDKKTDVNCLFEPEVPNVVFIDTTDKTDAEIDEERNECIQKDVPYCQIDGDLFSALSVGGYHNAAYDQITLELYNGTTYQTTVSMTAIPVYYLEPNVRVRVDDVTSMTHGDFMIQNMSIPYDVGQTMSVTANRCIEKR